jgi:hypothetical protein
MRSLICLLLSGAPALAGEVAVWTRDPAMTSAALAQGVVLAQPGERGLLASSAMLLPDGGTRVVTWFRWSNVNGPREGEDALYRCVDEMDDAGASRAAWCDVSEVEKR